MQDRIIVRESVTGRYKIEAENREIRLFRCGVQVGVVPISELGEEQLMSGVACKELDYTERILLFRLMDGIRINRDIEELEGV